MLLGFSKGQFQFSTHFSDFFGQASQIQGQIGSKSFLPVQGTVKTLEITQTPATALQEADARWRSVGTQLR